MPIEFRHLRYTEAALRHGSFRKAADALGLKQSNLSRRIRDLEDQLGLELFERTNAGSGRRMPDGTSFMVRATFWTNANYRECSAALERVGPAITPESLRRFALSARRKLRNEDGTYRRDHLRAVASALRSSVRARFASSARKPNCCGHLSKLITTFPLERYAIAAVGFQMLPRYPTLAKVTKTIGRPHGRREAGCMLLILGREHYPGPRSTWIVGATAPRSEFVGGGGFWVASTASSETR